LAYDLEGLGAAARQHEKRRRLSSPDKHKTISGKGWHFNLYRKLAYDLEGLGAGARHHTISFPE